MYAQLKRIPNNWYPILVWLFTVLIIGPIFSSVLMNYLAIKVNQEARDLQFNTLAFIEIGFLFSLPVFVIYFVVFKMLTYKNKPALFVKIYLNIICAIGIFNTFYIMSVSRTNVYFSLVYTSCAIISSLIFKVYSKDRNEIIINRR
jgi:hypothetical protein